MELAIAFTLYLSFCAFLFFGTMHAPPVFARMAIGLCFSELVVAIGWAVSRRTCLHRPCGEMVGTFESAAGLQIPAMTAATMVLAVAYGLHIVRRW